MLYSNLADIDAEGASEEGESVAEGQAAALEEEEGGKAGDVANVGRKGERRKGHRRGGQGAAAFASSSAGASLSSHVRTSRVQ